MIEGPEAYLENMFEWIGVFLPGINQMLVSLPHYEVQILVRLARDYAVVHHTLLVVRHGAPAIAMQRL